MMNDHPLHTAPDPPEDDPRLAAAVAELRRAVRLASPEDRRFVLGHLEALERRFRQDESA